jgi:hypothetical protein
MRLLVFAALLLVCQQTVAFFSSFPRTHTFMRQNDHSTFSPIWMEAGTSEKPLYDGTNYTFPDTTTPAGIAELLEVSFVNSCMQLRTGYVDVLKMFIAAATAGYELGFPIDEIKKELEVCQKQTARRPLMEEEVDLRRIWFSLVYLTLSSIGHPTRFSAVVESIPDELRDDYGVLIDAVAQSHKNGESLSVEELMKRDQSDLSEMERALKSQSMRVVTLTLQVLAESAEAREGGAQPPPPPIKGAFD